MARIDEDIKKNIVDTLYWDDRVDASDVSVEVDNGKVIFKGSVPSMLARMAAEEAAYTTAGVLELQNEIEIRPPEFGELPSDAQVASRVRDALLINPDIQITDIDVSVDTGIARLNGTVDALWKKGLAAELAGREKGVMHVENHLAVVPTKSIIDQSIADEIEAALESNALVDAEDIHLAVENGRVHLSGKLPTWSARRAAENAARSVAGVVDVDNRITVVSNEKT